MPNLPLAPIVITSREVTVSIPVINLHDVIADALTPALMAGASVLGAELMDRVPRGPRGANYNREFEPLESTMVTDIEVDREALTGTASTGFGKSGPVALWVEYGHNIVSRSDEGVRYTSPSGSERPGELLGRVPEHPFMRPAIDACADRVIEAVADSVVNSIMKAYGG